MVVAMISDWHTSGGAATAATRLETGLRAAGHQVHRLVFRQDHRNNTVVEVSPQLSTALAARLLHKLRSEGGRRRTVLSAAGEAFAQILSRINPDVVNIHNIHYPVHRDKWPVDLPLLAKHFPVVWTLHDMWSFTGRCAYAYDCRKFITGCDAQCPTPNEYPALPPTQINEAWRIKAQILRELPRIAAVCPSHWLARLAVEGMWRDKRVEVIPNGLPLNVFRPIKPSAAREVLGIDTTGPLLLIVADNLDDHRKGSLLLVDALRKAKLPQETTLMLMGAGDISVHLTGLRTHQLGYVHDAALAAAVYSSADALIHPAIADNLPNVVMESIACGTPVIAFDVGGLSEMVRPGITGWLAGPPAAERLAAALEKACACKWGGPSMRERCRAVAEAEWGLELQARRYTKLFETL